MTYPPPPPLSHYGPEPKRRSSTGKAVLIVALVVLALCGGGALVIAAGIGGAAKVVESAETDRLADVKIDTCKRTIIDTVEIEYTVINSSTVAQSYFIEVDITTPDGKRVGTGSGLETDIGPGTTATGRAIGTVTAAKGVKLKCTLKGA